MTMAIDRESITTDVLKDVPFRLTQQYLCSLLQVQTDLTSLKIRRNSPMFAHMTQRKLLITGQKVLKELGETEVD